MITNDKLVELESALADDDTAEAVGKELAESLYLKRDREHDDRWQTAWGTKTNKGLARTVVSIIADKLTV